MTTTVSIGSSNDDPAFRETLMLFMPPETSPKMRDFSLLTPPPSSKAPKPALAPPGPPKPSAWANAASTNTSKWTIVPPAATVSWNTKVPGAPTTAWRSVVKTPTRWVPLAAAAKEAVADTGEWQSVTGGRQKHRKH